MVIKEERNKEKCRATRKLPSFDSRPSNRPVMVPTGRLGSWSNRPVIRHNRPVMATVPPAFLLQKLFLICGMGVGAYCSTDPKVVDCFNRIDRDGNGVIDDLELQAVLSSTSAGQNFSLRTVHLLMFQFTHSNKRQIGPKEFVPLLSCLTNWRAMFQRYDRNRNGSIDSQELAQALGSLGYKVSFPIVTLLISKFSKSGGACSLKYDNFIECCLTVKGLTETFRAKEDVYGRATFGYEEFLLNVMPFIIA